MNNAEKLLKNIQEQKVYQKPRWQFICKNMLFWVIFALSVFLGGISFSIIIFAFGNADFTLLGYSAHSKIELIMSFIPFFWIFFLFLFSIFAFLGLQHTKKGYKISFFVLSLINIGLSIAIGGILFLLGSSEKIENIVSEKISFYESIEEKKIKQWSHPELGLLSGTIENIDDEKKIIFLHDFSQNIWTIYYREADIKEVVALEKNEKIKVMGESITQEDQKNMFNAVEIRPWRGKGFQKHKY
jgi:hypothetical protein